jgi:PucR C-terminal helix-turn-helix domain/GGDEF-like domain
MQEAEESDLFGIEELQRLGRAQAGLFDRIVDAVADQYNREAEGGAPTSEQRRAKCVESLLAGEFADTRQLAYDLDAWHLGLVAFGQGVEESIRALGAGLDRRVLLVSRGDRSAWGWLGGSRMLAPEQLAGVFEARWSQGIALAVGESAKGLEGWRFTHRQASAAAPIARSAPGKVTPYADVGLLASMLQDEVLVRSLTDRFLVPLAGERDGGAELRRTLRAYFAAGRNASSAAAALGVSRGTVANRLRTIDDHLGWTLDACGAEIEAALRLHDLSESRSLSSKGDTTKSTSLLYAAP